MCFLYHQISKQHAEGLQYPLKQHQVKLCGTSVQAEKNRQQLRPLFPKMCLLWSIHMFSCSLNQRVLYTYPKYLLQCTMGYLNRKLIRVWLICMYESPLIIKQRVYLGLASAEETPSSKLDSNLIELEGLKAISRASDYYIN